MPTTLTTGLSSISLPTSTISWGVTYNQLSEKGKKKWALFTICRNHPKVDMCHTSLTVDSPGKKLSREILPVGKTLISAPGCSLCLKGTGQPWFMSMASGLAGCPWTWRKIKLEMWWEDSPPSSEGTRTFVMHPGVSQRDGCGYLVSRETLLMTRGDSLAVFLPLGGSDCLGILSGEWKF